MPALLCRAARSAAQKDIILEGLRPSKPPACERILSWRNCVPPNLPLANSASALLKKPHWFQPELDQCEHQHADQPGQPAVDHQAKHIHRLLRCDIAAPVPEC